MMRMEHQPGANPIIPLAIAQRAKSMPDLKVSQHMMVRRQVEVQLSELGIPGISMRCAICVVRGSPGRWWWGHEGHRVASLSSCHIAMMSSWASASNELIARLALPRCELRLTATRNPLVPAPGVRADVLACCCVGIIAEGSEGGCRASHVPEGHDRGCNPTEFFRFFG